MKNLAKTKVYSCFCRYKACVRLEMRLHMSNIIGNNKFLRLTSSSTAAKSSTSQLNQVRNAANNIKQAQTSYKAGNVQNKNAESIFSSKSSAASSNTTGARTVSYEQFTQSLTGKKIEELTQAEKAQMQLVAAFADVDGDKKINEEEAKNLAGLDGDDKEIAQADIDKLYEELGVTNEAELEDLIGDIDEILNGVSTAATASTGSTAAISSTTSPAATSGTQAVKFQSDSKINSTTSGVEFDEKTGTYTVKVEQYRDGKVQDDGNGDTRYPNGSFWGIVTNAYPELKESDKEAVYKMIGEMNDFDWENHVLRAGDSLKLPVLQYDENGNVTGYQEKADEVKENAATASTGSTTATSSTGSTAATASTGSTAATSATASTGSTAATSSTGSTTSKIETLPSKNTQYINDVVANAENFLKNSEGDYSKFVAYVEKTIDDSTLSGTEKTQLFNDLLSLAKNNNIGYEFVTTFGDKIGKEDKSNAVLNLVNDKNYVTQNYTNIANDYVLASMKDMIADGNIDKALELEDAYNKRFGENNNTLRYSTVSSEDWANYTANLYAVAAKQGRLDDILKLDQYDSVTALQDGVKGKKEDKLMNELFSNLSETLPNETNINQAGVYAYEVMLSSGSVEDNLNEVLNSTTLDDSQKAYFLKQIMNSSDFTSEFRNMNAGAQESKLKDILAQVAKYTSV